MYQPDRATAIIRQQMYQHVVPTDIAVVLSPSPVGVLYRFPGQFFHDGHRPG